MLTDLHETVLSMDSHCYVAARIERERRRRSSYSTRGATVKRALFTTTIVTARAAREAGGRPGALPTAEQEGRDFLLNSCLIRLIHLLYLYREVYLTPNKGLLIHKQYF